MGSRRNPEIGANRVFYRRDFLQYVAMGAHDIKLDWNTALQAGEKIGVVNCTHEADWFDFGTPQGLWEASRFVMERSGQYSYQYHTQFAEARPHVSNEAGQEGLPEHLRNVLVLEETQRPVSASTHDCILGRNFRWNIQT
jgi:NDP-sugar pyrophosphorylase family protein